MRAVIGLVAAHVLLVSAPAAAQQVRQAQAMLTPTIYQDDNGYTGCGLRVVVATPGADGIVGSDFSVNLFSHPELFGTVKVAGMRCAQPCDPTDAKFIPIDSFRLSEEADGVPVKVLSTQPGDPPPFTFAITDLEDTVQMITALLGGKQVQLGFVPQGSATREVYSFAAETMAERDFMSFRACVTAVLDKTETAEAAKE
jgi:hypothetical protein